jgi:putative ABC transport system permease protein
VEQVGMTRSLPLAGTIGDWGVRIEGRPVDPGNRPKGDWQVVSPNYFETMGMTLVKGRFFMDGDRTDALQVAVINETMAAKYWPDEDPVGQRIRMGGRTDTPWATIVGIVGDVAHNGIDARIKEKFYRPHAQFHLSTGFAPRAMTLVTKTATDPMGMLSSIRREVSALDPNMPVANVQSLDDVLADSLSEPKFTTFLLGLFAIVALTLATVGIYGVISYAVRRRTHEIGIRMALGAERRQVLKMVLGQGLGLSLIGLLIGVFLAMATTPLMSSLLRGVGTTDLATFVIIPAALVLVSLAATYIPARRATRIDPMTALRTE